MPLGTFVRNACYTSPTRQEKRKDLLYAKDLPLPHEWRPVIMENIIPPSLRWMGENDFSKSLHLFISDISPKERFPNNVPIQ
jgi:hypothetical protein